MQKWTEEQERGLTCDFISEQLDPYAYFATVNKTTGNDKNLNIVTENLGDIKWEGTKVFESSGLLPGEMGIQTFTVCEPI